MSLIDDVNGRKFGGGGGFGLGKLAKIGVVTVGTGAAGVGVYNNKDSITTFFAGDETVVLDDATPIGDAQEDQAPKLVLQEMNLSEGTSGDIETDLSNSLIVTEGNDETTVVIEDLQIIEEEILPDGNKKITIEFRYQDYIYTEEITLEYNDSNEYRIAPADKYKVITRRYEEECLDGLCTSNREYLYKSIETKEGLILTAGKTNYGANKLVLYFTNDNNEIVKKVEDNDYLAYGGVPTIAYMNGQYAYVSSGIYLHKIDVTNLENPKVWSRTLSEAILDIEIYEDGVAVAHANEIVKYASEVDLGTSIYTRVSTTIAEFDVTLTKDIVFRDSEGHIIKEAYSGGETYLYTDADSGDTINTGVLKVVEDGVYVAFRENNIAYAGKYDFDGNQIFETKTNPLADSSLFAQIAETDDYVAFGGMLNPTNTHSDNDFYLLKLDKNDGSVISENTASDPLGIHTYYDEDSFDYTNNKGDTDKIYGVIALKNGRILLTGYSEGIKNGNYIGFIASIDKKFINEE